MNEETLKEGKQSSRSRSYSVTEPRSESMLVRLLLLPVCALTLQNINNVGPIQHLCALEMYIAHIGLLTKCIFTLSIIAIILESYALGNKFCKWICFLNRKGQQYASNP